MYFSYKFFQPLLFTVTVRDMSYKLLTCLDNYLDVSSIAVTNNQWLTKSLNLCMENVSGKSKTFVTFNQQCVQWLKLKACEAWRWVMQFQPGTRKWQLRSTLSVNALYQIFRTTRSMENQDVENFRLFRTIKVSVFKAEIFYLTMIFQYLKLYSSRQR